ncbi:hypothetical protein DL98DRAFT_515951 [Cadophora sp. DSE1049]|nr:hypothetical protein DL98DRAFT_515951 [Cadophora sp. DSE1049]
MLVKLGLLGCCLGEAASCWMLALAAGDAGASSSLGTFHEWDGCHGHGHCHVMGWDRCRILSSQDWDLRFAAFVPIPRQVVMSFMFDDAGPDAR